MDQIKIWRPLIWDTCELLSSHALVDEPGTRVYSSGRSEYHPSNRARLILNSSPTSRHLPSLHCAYTTLQATAAMAARVPAADLNQHLSSPFIARRCHGPGACLSFLINSGDLAFKLTPPNPYSLLLTFSMPPPPLLASQVKPPSRRLSAYASNPERRGDARNPRPRGSSAGAHDHSYPTRDVPFQFAAKTKPAPRIP